MIFTYGLGGLILIALLAFLFYKLTKAVIKTIILVIVAALLMLLIFGFLVVRDVNDLRANLPVKDSLILLEHQGQPVAGLAGPFMAEEQPEFISEEQLNQIKAEGFGEAYYKVFLVKSSAFDEITEINFDEQILTKEYVFSVLESEDPLDQLISERLRQEGMAATPEVMAAARAEMAKQGAKTDTDARNIMFGLLMASGIEKKGPLFIIEEFKDGQVEITPETVAFKLIKILPISFITRYVK